MTVGRLVDRITADLEDLGRLDPTMRDSLLMSQVKRLGLLDEAIKTYERSRKASQREVMSGTSSPMLSGTSEVLMSGTPSSVTSGTPEGVVSGTDISLVVSTSFSRFWSKYPRRIGKQDAFRAWKKHGCHKLVEEIIVALDRQHAWMTREEGRFIPNPATWLNQGRWDDEPPQSFGPQERRPHRGGDFS